MANDRAFLDSYDPADYDRPSVAVDVVLFTIREGTLQVLMTHRTEPPFAGCRALPGVFVGMDETLDEAASRALRTKGGLTHVYLEQLYTWGAPARDPRMRVISVSYYALVPERAAMLPEGTDAAFYPADSVAAAGDIAFDHAEIIACGRERIRTKVLWSDIAFSLLEEEFTLPQLQSVYEILMGQKLYKANFRKKLADRIEPTDKMTSGDAHRPSRIYRRRGDKEEKA
ncbi:MAG: NUDIX hydrolase [Oscillospiraceae bacterium]|nr:NUDIX hydrolase [Oscillospiraceae bacterium]